MFHCGSRGTSFSREVDYLEGRGTEATLVLQVLTRKIYSSFNHNFGGGGEHLICKMDNLLICKATTSGYACLWLRAGGYESGLWSKIEIKRSERVLSDKSLYLGR